MADPFIGEIRIFPYTFAPLYWAWCSGQIMNVQQNNVLFSIIGNLYGGDGRSTFALPDLRGRSPMHWGQGPNLTPRWIAQTTGSPAVTLTESQLPRHDHTAQASLELSTESVPAGVGSYPAIMLKKGAPSTTIFGYRTPDANLTTMAGQALSPMGQGVGHDNRQPCLGLYFCIALEGMYPSRD